MNARRVKTFTSAFNYLQFDQALENQQKTQAAKCSEPPLDMNLELNVLKL